MKTPWIFKALMIFIAAFIFYSIWFKGTDATATVSLGENNSENIYLPLLTNDFSANAPSSNEIVFTSDRTGSFDIYTMKIDGTDVYNLSKSGNQSEEDPDWSPDGKSILYTVDHAFIYIMDEYGKNKHFIAYGFSADFSPDGTEIVFSSNYYSEVVQIFKQKIDGSNLQQLTFGDTPAVNPSWSPDGEKIAYESANLDPSVGPSDIWLMDSDGDNQQNLTNNIGFSWAYTPTWSPDSGKIIFAEQASGYSFPYYEAPQIYTMNPDGTNRTLLTFYGSGKYEPKWSPIGNVIIFSASQGRYDAYSFDIFIMNSDGTNRTRLNENDSDDRHPDFRPGISYSTPVPEADLAYISSDFDTDENLYTMKSDGSQKTLLYDLIQGVEFSWSNQGDKIGYTRGGIHIFSFDSPNVHRLFTEYDYIDEFSWSPDDTQIVSPAYITITNQPIVLVNTDGTGAVLLTYGFIDKKPAWSPDSNKIAFASAREFSPGCSYKIFTMNRDGSNLTKLVDICSDQFTWSTDGTKIAFSYQSDVESKLYTIGVNGSQLLEVYTYPRSSTITEINWAPNGNKIAFTLSDLVDNTENIGSINVDGTNFVLLTYDGASDDPNWSSDSTKILFVSASDIFVMNGDGSNKINLTGNLYGNGWHPRWRFK